MGGAATSPHPPRNLTPDAGVAGYFEGALHLVLDRPGDTVYKLGRDLVYWIGGQPITIPERTSTDLASVPRLLRSIALADPLTAWAAVLHDWLYRAQIVVRAVADALFYAALRASGCSIGWARIYYYAVRAAGWRAWNRHANRKEASR